MKIGISAREQGDLSERSGFPPREAVIYEADLPLEVERSIQIIKGNFNFDNSWIPTAVQSYHGHGGNYGLDFRENEFNDVVLNPLSYGGSFTKNNLIARISFGMGRVHLQERKDKRETTYRSPKLLNRLHLNVFGSRQFLPENFKDMQKERDSFSYLSEKIHFSMRWLDGKFDSVWNDFYEFEKNIDNQSNHPYFNKMRSTYTSSEESTNHINGTFVQKAEQIKEKDKLRKISLSEVHKLLGTRRKILPKNLTREEITEQFSESFDPNNLDKIFFSMGRKRDFEIVGYGPALEILSEFGDISRGDEEKIIQMDMKEGLEYIFNNVFQAMRNYVNS